MSGKCPFQTGTSFGLPKERLEAAKREIEEFKQTNNAEEPDRKQFIDQFRIQ